MSTKWRSLRLAYSLGLVTLIASSVGAGWVVNRSRAGHSPTILSEPVEPAIVCFGYVDGPSGVTALAPLVAGRVTRVEVQENEPVIAGSVLIRLDDRLAQFRLRQVEASLAAAREQLAQARKLPRQQQIKVAQQRAAIDAVKYRVEGARTTLARKRRQAEKEIVGQTETDVTETLLHELEALYQVETGKLSELQLNDPDAGVRQAQADVDAKEAQLDEARAALEEYALKAPADGTALRVLVGPGDVVGAQAKQPAVIFCPAGRRIVRAEVEQEFARSVAIGQAASIRDDSNGEGGWSGRVVRISDWYTQRRSIMPEPLQYNDARTLECIIELDTGQPGLRIGQRVRVTLRPAAG
ncbi:MAG TPA: biotin/lipoyl-binding protein [Gemmataceae bacterium]|nr:biotin/lipoyl-binding protein [Gemmataceae bacterium]